MVGSAAGERRLRIDRVSALRPADAGGLLREVDLEVRAGQCLALLADRRSGGSLLLDVVGGPQPPTRGPRLCAGRGLVGLRPGRRRLGIVSARDPLFPHLDVRRNVEFALLTAGVPGAERRRRVDETVALLGLDGVAARRPKALDPEMAVRTAIARAVVTEPRLLLLDDPFVPLEPLPRQALQRILRRLVRARGLTALLVTGDRNEALLLGDEIGLLERGRLHQVGPARRLLDHPADATVAQRLGDANLLTGRVVRVDDEVALVRLACGHEVEAEPGELLREAALCVLCVPPDRIATAFPSRPGGEPGGSMVPATLQEAVHFGDHLRLRFRLADGGEVLVRRPPAAVTVELHADRPALLAWQPHHARAFAATSDA